VVNVIEFGVVGDGATLNTTGLQNALNQIAAAGGGEIFFPPGVYLTGGIQIFNNTTIHLSPGSVLLGSRSLSDYQPTGPEPKGDLSVYHLLHAADAKNIIITGGGTVDGQGEAFWDHRPGPKTDDFRGYPLPISPSGRPSPMIDFRRCENIRFENIKVVNAAGWNIHTQNCRKVWIKGVQILNPMTGPNTDGLDINGCRDVIISDCHIETGDDAICLKTDRGADICERIVISNCILASRTCAVKLGTGIHNDIRQVSVSNCVVYQSEKAFGIYAFDGGLVEDILVNGMVVETSPSIPNFADRPIHIDVRRRDPESRLSKVRGVTLKNMLIRSPGRIMVTAVAESLVENLRLEQICLQVSGTQNLAEFINPSPSSMQFSKALPHLREIPAHLVFHGIKGLSMAGVEVINASGVMIQGMNGLYLEHVEGYDGAGFSCYPLEDGSKLVVIKESDS
jgi:hypothetical protein